MEEWPSYEIIPLSGWNYGLVLDTVRPESSFKIIRHGWPEDNYPFSVASVPISLQLEAKKIPGWKIDKHGLAAELQDSPVWSDEPVERVTLIPMGAARLRISAFPVIGYNTDANRWE